MNNVLDNGKCEAENKAGKEDRSVRGVVCSIRGRASESSLDGRHLSYKLKGMRLGEESLSRANS